MRWSAGGNGLVDREAGSVHGVVVGGGAGVGARVGDGTLRPIDGPVVVRGLRTGAGAGADGRAGAPNTAPHSEQAAASSHRPGVWFVQK